jgi:hypothetical protein
MVTLSERINAWAPDRSSVGGATRRAHIRRMTSPKSQVLRVAAAQGTGMNDTTSSPASFMPAMA